MGVETRLLGGRVRIRRRPGAGRQFLRGAVGVLLVVAAASGVVYVLPFVPAFVLGSLVVEPASPTEYLTTGKGVYFRPTLPPVEVPSARRATLLLLGPLFLSLAGLVAYAVRWRRDYEVRVVAPDGLLGWD